MEVIKLQNKAGELTATSLEIARVLERKHYHIMEEIRKELEWSTIENIEPIKVGKYTASNGKQNDMYILDEYETLQVMSKYSKEVRAMVINEFKRMKEHIKAQQTAPMTVEQLLAANAQMIGELQNKVIEMKPKADFFDQVADSKTALNMDQVANTHNIGRNKLFAFLRDKKVLKDNNMPYQNYIDKGWFRVIEQKYQKPNGEWCINTKTLVYQRGSAGIGKLLSAK